MADVAESVNEEEHRDAIIERDRIINVNQEKSKGIEKSQDANESFIKIGKPLTSLQYPNERPRRAASFLSIHDILSGDYVGKIKARPLNMPNWRSHISDFGKKKLEAESVLSAITNTDLVRARHQTTESESKTKESFRDEILRGASPDSSPGFDYSSEVSGETSSSDTCGSSTPGNGGENGDHFKTRNSSLDVDEADQAELGNPRDGGSELSWWGQSLWHELCSARMSTTRLLLPSSCWIVPQSGPGVDQGARLGGHSSPSVGHTPVSGRGAHEQSDYSDDQDTVSDDSNVTPRCTSKFNKRMKFKKKHLGE